MIMFGRLLKRQMFATTMVFAFSMHYVWVIWCVHTTVVHIFVIMAVQIQHDGRGILPIHHPLGHCWIRNAHTFVTIASITLSVLFYDLQRCNTLSISSIISHAGVCILVLMYAQLPEGSAESQLIQWENWCRKMFLNLQAIRCHLLLWLFQNIGCHQRCWCRRKKLQLPLMSIFI